MTNAKIIIGEYADPPELDRYFIRTYEGTRIERTEQKLANGGYHYLDVHCDTAESEEWFDVPDENGSWCKVCLVDR